MLDSVKSKSSKFSSEFIKVFGKIISEGGVTVAPSNSPKSSSEPAEANSSAKEESNPEPGEENLLGEAKLTAGSKVEGEERELAANVPQSAS